MAGIGPSISRRRALVGIVATGAIGSPAVVAAARPQILPEAFQRYQRLVAYRDDIKPIDQKGEASYDYAGEQVSDAMEHLVELPAHNVDDVRMKIEALRAEFKDGVIDASYLDTIYSDLVRIGAA